jgi:DNA-binding NarL/FixJ family response regulator
MDAGDALSDDARLLYERLLDGGALRRILAGRQRALLDALVELDDHYERLSVLDRRPPDGTPWASAGLEVIGTPVEVAARWHELSSAARGPCRCLRATGPARAQWHSARRRNQLSTASRSRTLCGRAALEDPTELAEAEQLVRAGAELRILADVPLDLVIGDAAALISVESRTGVGAILVSAPELVGGLVHYFELLWSRGVPLGCPRPGSADGPTPAQRQVLRLAAAGLKDESIARSLGRSSRWVRRQFEALEERLGASNRLTLGMAAAKRGWV